MDAAGSTARRDALYFILGPSLITLAAVAAFKIHPWPVPIPSQGQLLQPAPVIVVLLLGLVGTILFFLVDYAERLILPWHVSQRARHERSAERV